MKFIDLFGGIGGFRLGMESAKYECVWYNDVDKYAVDVYNRRFDEENEPEDIRKVGEREISEHDCICAGFLCQSFSIAGRREGMEDTRGTLFFEICRIARHHRPKMLFLENVRGLLSHDKGETFRIILKSLWDLGYDVEWQVLNSKNYGVPQNRERVFIVGHLGGFGGRQIFPLGEVAGNLDKPREEAEGEGLRVRLADTQHPRGRHFQKTIYNPEGISPTLREGHGDVIRITANSLVVGGQGRERNLIQKGILGKGSIAQRVYDSEGIGVSLRAEGGGLGAKTGLYTMPMRWKRTEKGKEMRRKSQKEGRDYTPFSNGCRELVQSKEVVSGCVTGAINKDSLLSEAVIVHSLQPRSPDRPSLKYSSGGSGHLTREDGKSFCLDAGNCQAVELPEVANAVDCDGHLRKGERLRDEDGKPQLLPIGYRRIRRLTPIECERLQSFPDNWTEYGMNGKISDTQRYKMLGNAVTVNVIKAIAERLTI